MQVFKAYLKIVRTRLTSVIIYFVIFIGIAVALSTLGGENEAKQFTKASLDIAVENLDEGELGDALLDYLALYNELEEKPESENELLDAIYNREYDYVLYIPADFTERFLAGEREEILTNRKVPSSTTGAYADSQIESYLQTLGMYVDAGFTLEESIANTQENLSVSADVEFLEGEDAAVLDAAVYYLQYLPYIFICTVMSLVGPILMIFQKKDINARNKCSSMSFFNRNMQLFGASVLVMMVEYVILMVIGFILYPDYMCSVRGVVALINAFLMILIAMALTYFAVQFVKSKDALSGVSNVFGLGLAFLGGVFVPLDIFGETMLQVAKFTPTYWYVTANTRINKMTAWSDFSAEIMQSFVIELIFAVAVLAIGLLLNRMKARE